MAYDRAIFFERNDSAYGMGFIRIESLVIPEYDTITINDAIEYFEIKRYIDDGIRAKSWTDEKYEEYKEKSKKLNGLCMRFFNSLSDDNIVQLYNTISNFQYRKSFWIIFDLCHLYMTISSETFYNLLHAEHFSLFDILIHKKISEHYGEILHNYILESFEYIHLILQVYEQDFSKTEKIYLPIEFSGQDICNYISAYIDSDHPHLKHMEKIVQMRATQAFPITDEIRLKAKRKHELLSKTIIDQGISFEYGIGVSFDPNQVEEKRSSGDMNKPCFSYSTKWLLETLDYPSILNNFIYIFEFTDVPQMRCLHVVRESMSGVFERAMCSKSIRIYPVNQAFAFTNQLAGMQMLMYYNFLYANKIRYEEVLKWFFTQYLQEEFSCPEMRVSFPSDGTTFEEKCYTVCSAIESILKQFTLYYEHNEIDFELLSLTSGSKKFSDIPSLNKNKYIYGTGKDFNDMKYALFSDQCMLSFVERIYNQQKRYKSFYELITHEDVFVSDYCEEDIQSIKWLEGKDLLSISDEEKIKIGNPWKVLILKDLFENDVICKWHYSPEVYPIFQEWIDSGILFSKSSLLSDPEVKYFNYILNDAEYDNGLKLRNAYSHGNQQGIIDDSIHKKNYFIILRILTILVIKINDDFILKETTKESD